MTRCLECWEDWGKPHRKGCVNAHIPNVDPETIDTSAPKEIDITVPIVVHSGEPPATEFVGWNVKLGEYFREGAILAQVQTKKTADHCSGCYR